MDKQLLIEELHVAREGQEIVKGVTLAVRPGELTVLLGPNGSGKTSLVSALMGHPRYRVTGGRLSLDGADLAPLTADARARLGLFLSVQHPPEIPGVTVSSFLRAAWSAVAGEAVGVAAFRERLLEQVAVLKMDKAFLTRGLNEGFSGGERKRLEMLQLAVLEPRYALLDETDSGLDVDALKIVTESVTRALARGAGVLLITHNPRVLEELQPQAVHVLCGGRLVASGGAEVARRVAQEGYASFGC